MTRTRPIAAAISAAALAAMLTSCAPAVVTPSSSPSPTSVVAAPTPTPTQASPAIPVVRVPLGCSDLLTDSYASTLASGSPLQLRRDENTVPQDLDQVAVRQRGTLACEWGGQTQTDGGYDNDVTVYIAVDAAAEYESNVPGLEQQSSPDAVNTVGNDSEYECETGTGDYQCSSNMLVGTSWVSAYIHNTYDGHVSKAVLDSRMNDLLSGVAEKLTAAGAAFAAWNAPSETSPEFCPPTASTSAASTAVVRSAFGDSALKFINDDERAGYSDAQMTSGSSDDVSSCVWMSGAHQIGLSSLAGGSWVFPELATAAPFVNMIGKLTPVTIAGADAAVMGRGPGGAEALIAIGPDAYSLSFDDAGQAKDIAELTALIEHL